MCDFCKPPLSDNADEEFPAKEIEACDENAGEPILPIIIKYLGEKLFAVRMRFEYGEMKAETEVAEAFCDALLKEIEDIFSESITLTDKGRQKLRKILEGYFGLAGNLFEFNFCPVCGRDLSDDIDFK